MPRTPPHTTKKKGLSCSHHVTLKKNYFFKTSFTWSLMTICSLKV